MTLEDEIEMLQAGFSKALVGGVLLWRCEKCGAYVDPVVHHRYHREER